MSQRPRPVSDVEQLRAQLEAHAVTARALSHREACAPAPRASPYTPSSTGYLEYNFDGSKRLAPHQAEAAREEGGTNTDGNCLFDALAGCLIESHRWYPHRLSDCLEVYDDARKMRAAICNVLEHPPTANFYDDHRQDVVDVAKRLPGSKVTNFESALPYYINAMRRDKTWGGFVEIDAAAARFGVKILVYRDDALESDGTEYDNSVLSATFTPPDGAPPEDEVAPWILIHTTYGSEGDHFLFVPPEKPPGVPYPFPRTTQQDQCDVAKILDLYRTNRAELDEWLDSRNLEELEHLHRLVKNSPQIANDPDRTSYFIWIAKAIIKKGDITKIQYWFDTNPAKLDQWLGNHTLSELEDLHNRVAKSPRLLGHPNRLAYIYRIMAAKKKKRDALRNGPEARRQQAEKWRLQRQGEDAEMEARKAKSADFYRREQERVANEKRMRKKQKEKMRREDPPYRPS